MMPRSGFCATASHFWGICRLSRLAGLKPALVSAGVGGTGLTVCEYRLFVEALPRLVRKGVKNSDDSAVGG